MTKKASRIELVAGYFSRGAAEDVCEADCRLAAQLVIHLGLTSIALYQDLPDAQRPGDARESQGAPRERVERVPLEQFRGEPVRGLLMVADIARGLPPDPTSPGRVWCQSCLRPPFS